MDQGSEFWYVKSSLKTCPLRNEHELCRPIWNLVAAADKTNLPKEINEQSYRGKSSKIPRHTMELEQWC